MERPEKMLKPKAYNGKEHTMERGDMGIQYSFTRFLMPKGDWIRVDLMEGVIFKEDHILEMQISTI